MNVDEFKNAIDAGGYLARYLSETKGVTVPESGEMQIACPDAERHAHGDKHKSARYYPSPGAHVHCHGCGGNWDIFALVMRDEGCDFMGAVKSLARRYGFDVAGGGPGAAVAAAVRPPIDGDAGKCAAYVAYCAGRIGETDYLSRRGISIETCRKFGVGFDPVERRVILPHGAAYAARAVDASNGLRYKYPKGVTPGPFNLAALWESGGRPVFVVEGAIDALSVIEAGGCAVGLGGITHGRGLVDAIKADGRPVPVPVVVAFDNEDPGSKAAANVSAKLSVLRAELRSVGVFVFDGSPVAAKHHDANEQLVADRAGLAAGIAEVASLASAAFSKKDEKPSVPTFADFGDPVPESENPRALIVNGWLRKGGGAIVVSTAGAGKSVFSLQVALHWAAGRECLGIKPVRKLKIAVIQSEDDEDEMRWFKVSMFKGMRADGWTEDEIRSAAKSVYFPSDCFGCAGQNFVNSLRSMQRRDHYDLVIVNPLFAYFGDDLSDNRADVHFFRELLDPVLKDPEHGFGIMFIHHANKPPRGKDSAGWGTDDFAQYIGAGGTDLAGWARAQLVFLPVAGKMGYFRLLGAKRADALGWKNEKGEKAREKYIAHSDGYAYWRVPTSEEIAGLVPQGGGVVTMDYLKRVQTLAQRLISYPLPASEARNIARALFGRVQGDEAWEAIRKNPNAYHVDVWQKGRCDMYGRQRKAGEGDGADFQMCLGLGEVSKDPPKTAVPDIGTAAVSADDVLPAASKESAAAYDFEPQEEGEFDMPY